MDITSKYRTRYPPKEHEEAVRMLLEGIGKPELQNDAVIAGDNRTSATASSNSYEYDGRSNRSSLSPSIVSSEHLTTTNLTATNSKLQKATSTGEDSNSSSEIDHDAIFKEPIPSRTIAVQCDLKSSSMKRIGDNLFDGGMQASSISSTRYGFYNFTPETLENRRKMQRSVSSRDLTSSGSSGSRGQHQVEAPTSMSELSVSDSGVENRQRNARSVTRPPDSNAGKFAASSSSYSSSSNSYTVHHSHKGDGANKRWWPAADADHRLEQSSRMNRLGEDGRLGKLSAGDCATARARINSLPRRPMTALSYVSSTKLRDQQSSPNSYRNGDSSERMQPIKNRAMSQQTLTRPRTPAPEFAGSSSVSSDSGSELDSMAPRSRLRSQCDDGRPNDQLERKYRQLEAQQAPTTLSRRTSDGLISPTKPPRPTLISSKHEEQIHDYKTLDRSQTSAKQNYSEELGNERSGYKYTARHAPEMSPSHRSRLTQDGNEFEGKFATIDRSAPSSNNKDPYEPAEYSSRLRSHRSMMRQPISEPRQASTRDGSPLRDVDYKTPRPDYQLNSMSLARRTRPLKLQQHLIGREEHAIEGPEMNGTSGYYTAGRVKPHKLSRSDRAYSQANLQKSPTPYLLPASETVRRPMNRQEMPEVEASRSTSVRQLSRPINLDRRYDPNMYATPINQDSIENHELGIGLHTDDQLGFNSRRAMEAREFTGRDLYRANQEANIESSLTRTWANPSARATLGQPITDTKQLDSSRKSSRSYSMPVNNPTDFDKNDTKRYERYQEDYHTLTRKKDPTSYRSSSESSSLEDSQKFKRQQQQPLDYDSQHRLNEIGLPEVNPFMSTTRSTTRPEGPVGSYLGTNISYGANDGLYTNPRAPQITGRALSQQSLTRPTMPLTSARRRGGGSNHSGSDVGGSSMSLVSRLQGRYENAHTRTPVVMYIPKVMPRAGSHSEGSGSLIGKSSTLRKSSRSRHKSSSQDRTRRRSSSRNGSDSESSSMLRTLVRPRGSRVQTNYSSKRAARIHSAVHDDQDEDIDGIGQLASEMDTYKFRRRYSVPKDAKINWFAKLKQRVSSGGK